MLGSNYNLMFQVIITFKHSLSLPCTVSLYTPLQFQEPEQKLEAQGCLGTDLVTMPTAAILLFIHTIKAMLMKKERGNEIINYN